MGPRSAALLIAALTLSVPAVAQLNGVGPAGPSGAPGATGATGAAGPNNLKDGSATSDTNGNITVTFGTAFSSAPYVTLSPIGTTTYSCQLTAAATTTSFTANCATIVSAGLGGATTRTNAANVVVHWHAAI